MCSAPSTLQRGSGFKKILTPPKLMTPPKWLFPIDRDGAFEVGFGVDVGDGAIGDAEFVEEFGGFDVVAAVFGDFFDFALFPPAEGVEASGGFVEAEGGFDDGVEADAVAEDFFEVEHEVEGGDL